MSDIPQPGSQEHKLLGKVFHLISQPMTASYSARWNSLSTPWMIRAQCRTWIESALESSERLRCRLSLAREIAEAAEVDEGVEPVDLRSLLTHALSEVEPLFPGVGAPQLRCGEMQVAGDRGRLLRAFLYLLQQLSVADPATSDIPEVRVSHEADLIEIRFSGFVLRQGASKDHVASQLEIANEIFKAAGGGMIFFCFGGNDAMVSRVYLRAPQPQLDLYKEAARKKPAKPAIGTTAVFPQVS